MESDDRWALGFIGDRKARPMKLEMTARPEQPKTSLLARLGQVAAQNPDAWAIVCDGDRLSYHDLATQVGIGAARLRELGCSEGSRIAILSPNSIDYIPAFFSAIACGGSAVTLPTMLTAQAIAAMLDDCEAKVVVASPDQQDLLRGAIALANVRPQILEFWAAEDRGGALFGGASSTFEFASAVPSDLDREFNIVYSSGTTGRPKGILHSHRTRTAFAAGMAGLGFDRQCVTLISTPLYTNMSIPAFLATLWGGGTVSVMVKFDPLAFLNEASRGATHFFLVPVQVQRIFGQPDFSTFDLSASRLKYVAGSVLDAELKNRLLDDWPGAFVEVYGMTEGAPVTVLLASEYRDKLWSVGRPPDGAQIAIIDDAGAPLPPGSVGEIVGTTNSMMIGYNNLPQETANIEWHDAADQRFFRSGDLGYLDDDGFLYIVDRKKDVIISGGYNIYSSDLEQVLLSHPAIDEVAVVGVKSDRWGETPVGFVTVTSGASLTEGAILVFANEKLGRYQQLSAIVIVGELPRNALGKIVKRELAARWNEMGPASSEGDRHA